MKLGSPGNTFTQLHKMTWEVYRDEILPRRKLSRLRYWKEVVYHYFMVLLFKLFFFGVRLRAMFGLQVTQEELKDFELDTVREL